MSSDKDGITAEVNDRLDDLFGDESSAKPPDEAEPRGRDSGIKETKKAAPSKPKEIIAENSLIKDLKSVVLSLEWEITDPVMQKLGEEIDKLKDSCKDDKIVVAFLQLLDALGKYIQKKQAEAHPDSISLLNSVYDNLETVMLSPDLSQAAKKKMLVSEMNKYKELKKHISKPAGPRKAEEKPDRKASDERLIATPFPSEEQSPTDEGDGAVIPSGISADQDIIVHMLQEINKTIKAEFEALREELRLWRESR